MEVQMTPSMVEEAAQRIGHLVVPTPLISSLFLQKMHGTNVYLKLENLNLTGAFKIRGALNALLQIPRDTLSKGVVAASAGNHAQAVARVAYELRVPADIFMPQETPAVKVELTRSLGATVHLEGANLEASFVLAEKFSADHNKTFLHPFADPRVIIGQGTAGLEILQQLPEVSDVIVPVGGGGLICGIAMYLKTMRPTVRIIGVQAENYPSHYGLFHASHPLDQYKPTIAEGIAVKKQQPLNQSMIAKYVDDIVLVNEEQIASSVMTLMERIHLLTEGAGAVGIAALPKIPALGPNVVVVISGGNIDMSLLQRIISRGRIASGRLCRLRFILRDRPGEMARLLKVISESGANLNEVYHNRAFTSTHYSDVDVDVELEVASRQAQEELFRHLQDEGFRFFVTVK